MTTSTFSVSCPADAWTEIAAGSSYSSVSLQSASGAVQIAVAASTPADDSLDFVLLNAGPLSAIVLASGDIVYGRPLNDALLVRGIRVAAS